MIRNNAFDLDGISATVTITGLSIYLDGTAGANYTVYVVEEPYITVVEGNTYSMLGGVLGDEGEVDSVTGVDSVGWRRHGLGYIDENSMNAQGMAVLTLDSPIVMTSESEKSVYVKLSAVDLCVMERYDDGSGLAAETVDRSVVRGEGFEDVDILVGRAVSC